MMDMFYHTGFYLDWPFKCAQRPAMFMTLCQVSWKLKIRVPNFVTHSL